MNTEVLLRQIQTQYRANIRPMPAKRKAAEWVDRLINSLFPIRQAEFLTELELRQLELGLEELLLPLKEHTRPCDKILTYFFDTIPLIYKQLNEDANAFLEFDPAAFSIEEIITSYPGFYAIAVYRISHRLYQLGIPVLPRMISEYAHSQTGIDIHPGATIGDKFFIDHGTGVVIGETCVIGNNVKIYQGVTLGALSVQKSENNTKRHPTIEENVTIYSGSTILGGKTVVGHDSVIGGNVWLTHSIEPFSLVYHKSEIRVRTTRDLEEELTFVI